MTLSRRQFLRNAALAPAVLPFVSFLHSLQAAPGPASAPRRLVILFTPNGVLPELWFPKAIGPNVALPPMLRPLQRHAGRLLVIQGLINRQPNRVNEHAIAVSSLLTGQGMMRGVEDLLSAGISVDQAIARELAGGTRFPSLALGESVAPEVTPYTRLSYSAAGRPVTPENDPRRVFTRVFGGAGAVAARRSVLDYVLGDIARLRPALSSADRELLDAHAEAVRGIERTLGAASMPAGCQPPPTPPDAGGGEPSSRPRIAKLQIDLLVRALACDQTRVATLQFTNGQSRAVFPWLGFYEGHHELSHSNWKDVSIVDKLVKINAWYAEQVAYLLDALSAVPESGAAGSLLDHTTVVWMNELAHGSTHARYPLPTLVAGGGYFRLGRVVRLSNVSHNRFLLTLCRGMGLQTETFGDPAFCQGGPIAELT